MSALREFVSTLEQRGLLLRVTDKVDWRQEIGQIARVSKLPILFDNIKEYPNKRLFANGLADLRTMAIALGIQDQNPSLESLAEFIRNSFKGPIEPILGKTPVSMENTQIAEIDLGALPVPIWSDIDAGRFIGTWHINISRDQETHARNVGVYRMQIVGPHQTTVSISPLSHLARQISIAERGIQPLPMAMAIGVDERLVIAAAAAPGYGVDELALAGGLMGRPVEIAPCLTQPLEVPADAEIVIEGVIKPRVRIQDGPFLDYAGIPSTNRDAHLFEVTALHFRDALIFRGAAIGRAGAEDHQLYSVLAQARMADFHGSRIRHLLQTSLLRRRAFGLFQLAGRIGSLARNKD